MEKEMATHCSILAWEIPWTEEPGGQQSIGLQSPTRLKSPTQLKHTQNLRWAESAGAEPQIWRV